MHAVLQDMVLQCLFVLPACMRLLLLVLVSLLLMLVLLVLLLLNMHGQTRSEVMDIHCR